MTRYRTIVADPPWPERSFDGGGWRYASRAVRDRAADPNKRYPLKPLPYKTMSVDAIASLRVGDLAEADAHVFVWTFDRFVVNGDTQRVIESWGFRVLPRMIVWHKASAGLGTTMRPAHELVMIGRRGKKGFKSTAGAYTTVGTWKQPYENGAKAHSAKPDGLQDMVEQLCDGPYLEMFSRRARLGWDTWGEQALGGTVVMNGGQTCSESSAIALIRQQWPLRHVYAHYRQSLRWNIAALRRVRLDEAA